jgi:glycyl-tRNA synthetase
MLMRKKDKFESKGVKYLEKKAEQREVKDPLELTIEFLKEKDFIKAVESFDTSARSRWIFGHLAEKMRSDLCTYWRKSTSGTLSSLKDIPNITVKSGTEFLIEMFAEENLNIPFGFSRIIENPLRNFSSDKFIFDNATGKKLVLEYAVVPSTSKDMLVSWIDFTLDFISKLGVSNEDLEIEYQTLKEHPDPEHYFYDRYCIKNIFHFGAEEIATVSNKLDFEFENYDKKFPEDKKQKCFVHDELRQNDCFPHVIEIMIDVEKLILAILLNNFHQERLRTTMVNVLKLAPQIAPVKCVVLPLSTIDKKTVIATERLFNQFNKDFKTLVDDKGTLEMRMVRHNETGVPFYVSVDPNLSDENMFCLYDNKFGTKAELSFDEIVAYIKSKIKE